VDVGSNKYDHEGLGFLIGLILLQVAMIPCTFAALYFWSQQKTDAGWGILACGWGCWIASKILSPRKVKEKINGPPNQNGTRN